MNKKELLSEMILHDDTRTDLAEALGMSIGTLNAKINETNGRCFNQPEIAFIKDRYDLTAEKVDRIFLLQKCLKKKHWKGETKMNEVQLFNFENHEVRSLLINDEPYFVGKDVADVLGYADTNQAIRKHVDNEDRLTRRFDGTGQSRDMTIINESGLYSLVLSSKLPSAKKFKRWVTSEVLPALRKTGQYQVKELSGQELMAKALIEAQNVLAAKDKQIEEMKPKALFADAVSASKGSISVGSLAKLLAQNGIAIGQNRLFAWLRDNNFLIKDGKSKNVATQRYIDQGLFELKANVTFENGETKTHKPTTMVTGKGQRYFIDLFLDSQE